MKKTEKKTEKAIVNALNVVCECLKNKSDGFSWLTHFVDYGNFPDSLKLVFVFDTKTNLECAKNVAQFSSIYELVDAAFKREGIHVEDIDKVMFFDAEENGADVYDMKWCRKYSR